MRQRSRSCGAAGIDSRLTAAKPIRTTDQRSRCLRTPLLDPLRSMRTATQLHRDGDRYLCDGRHCHHPYASPHRGDSVTK
jgi:hypothetical protein